MIVIVLLAIAGGFLLSRFGAIPRWEYSSGEIPFSYPVYAVSGGDQSLYVVDLSLRRLVKMDASGMLRFSLKKEKTSADDFFYITGIAPRPDGGFYLLGAVPGKQGRFFVAERIFLYDQTGRFERTVYSLEHDPLKKDRALMSNGRVKRLKFDAETQTLSWFELYPDFIRYARLDGAASDSDVAEPVFQDVPCPHADRDISDICLYQGDSLIYTHKTGRIFRIDLQDSDQPAPQSPDFSNPKSQQLLFCGEQEGCRPGFSVVAVPRELDCDTNGNIFFVDLTHREIRRFKPGTKPNGEPARPETIFALGDFEDEDSFLYRLNVAPDGTVTTTTDTAVWHIGGGAMRSWESAPVPPATRRVLAWQMLGWFCCGIALTGALILIYYHIFGFRLPPVLLISVGFIVTVALTSTLLYSAFLAHFSKRSTDNALKNLQQLALVLAVNLDDKHLERITRPADYMNDDYAALQHKLEQILALHASMEGLGYDLYTVVDDRLYELLALDTTICPYYPYNWLDDPEQGYAAAWSGDAFAAYTSDISGDWLYALAPVRDKEGTVVAILEVNQELLTFQEQNRLALRKTFFDTLSFLVIAVLVLIEVVFLFNIVYMRGTETQLNNIIRTDVQVFRPLRKYLLGDYSPSFLVRPLAFFYFTAQSIALTFLPLMMKSFYKPIPGFSEEFVLAVPYSVIMLSFGVSNLIAGTFVNPHTIRRTMYIGFGLSLIGLLLAAAANGMLLFVVAMALLGAGGGHAYIGIRSVLFLERRCGTNEAGFAHFYAGCTAGANVGIILGAVLAERYGYSAAFLAAAGVLCLAVLLEWLQIRRFVRLCRPKTYSVDIKPESRFFILFRDPRVLPFLLLDTIPGMIVVAFLFYFFPLFAAEHGKGTSTVGWFLLLAGILTIYCTAPLVMLINKMFRREYALYTGTAIWACCLLCFVCTGSWAGAVGTVLLLGLCDGFVESCANSYYLHLQGTREAGEGPAVAYRELTSKIGDSIGPMVFAAALLLGPRFGIALICCGCLTCTALLFTFNRFFTKPLPREEDGGTGDGE